MPSCDLYLADKRWKEGTSTCCVSFGCFMGGFHTGNPHCGWLFFTNGKITSAYCIYYIHSWKKQTWSRTIWEDISYCPLVGKVEVEIHFFGIPTCKRTVHGSTTTTTTTRTTTTTTTTTPAAAAAAATTTTTTTTTPIMNLKGILNISLSLFLSNLKVPPIRVWNRIVPKVK